MINRNTRYLVTVHKDASRWETLFNSEVRYDDHLKTWTASITIAEFYDTIIPTTKDGDRIYFGTPEEAMKWCEKHLHMLANNIPPQSIPGYQHNQHERDYRAKRDAEKAAKEAEAALAEQPG